MKYLKLKSCFDYRLSNKYADHLYFAHQNRQGEKKRAFPWGFFPSEGWNPAPSPISDLILSLCQCIQWLVSSEGPCPVQSATNVIPAFLFSLSEGEYENMIKYHGRRILKSEMWIVLEAGRQMPQRPRPRPGLSHRSGDFSWNPGEWI